MSGGVDSAVALQRIVDRGDEAVGITLRLWIDPDAPDAARACCSPEAVRRARATCHALGVPHITLDARDGFREIVVQPFLDDYQAGRTPEPVHHLQRRLPHRAAGGDGAQRSAPSASRPATTRDSCPTATGRWWRAAQISRKDQSAMLARVPPELLGMLEFPLADAHKQDVRREAADAGLAAAAAPESQDVCFLGGGDLRGFLDRHGVDLRPGEIHDTDGTVRRPPRGRRRVHDRPAPRARRRRTRGAVRALGGRGGGRRHDRAAGPARAARGRADRRHAAPAGLARPSAPARAHGRRRGDGRDVRRGHAPAPRRAGLRGRAGPGRRAVRRRRRGRRRRDDRRPPPGGGAHDPPGVRARRPAERRRTRPAGRTWSSCAPRRSSSACTSSRPARRTARSRTTRTRSTSCSPAAGASSVDGDDVAVGPGSILFVAKHAVHRFHSIEEDLSIVVAFSPPRAR